MCPYQCNPILFCDRNCALSTSETIDAAVPSFILKISILSKIVYQSWGNFNKRQNTMRGSHARCLNKNLININFQAN